jgi:hypothetical protein
VWIDLVEPKTDTAVECLALSRAIRARGAAIFPVSFASMSELLEQPPEAAALTQAKLMDELGDGVSLRAPNPIRVEEYDAAFAALLGAPFVAPTKSVACTAVGEYIGDAYLDFAAAWPPEQATAYTEAIRDAPPMRSVEAMLRTQDRAALRARHAEARERYVARFTAALTRIAEQFRRKDGRLDRDRILLEEQLRASQLLAEAVRNRLVVLHGPERGAALAAQTELGQAAIPIPRFRELLTVMPSVALHCELMTARVCNPGRRVRPSDFYDIEHASVAAVYADAFATERGLASTLTNECPVVRSRGCRVVRGVRGLRDLLLEWSEHTLTGDDPRDDPASGAASP